MPASYALDVPAVKAWAAASDNESNAILNHVKGGDIAVYNRVWDSFKVIYPDEAKEIAKDEFTCQRCTEVHRLTAAAMADRLNATFPILGAYDDALDWTMVGIARSEGLTIVTDQPRKERYQQIDGLSVITYDELLVQL